MIEVDDYTKVTQHDLYSTPVNSVFRHFVLADGVTDVRIVGLSLVNGLANDGDDASGGCVFMGTDTSLHLLDITFRNCSAPGVCVFVCVCVRLCVCDTG